MGSKSTGPPPFFWKVPVQEKNHMAENYRRMRKIGAQGQEKLAKSTTSAKFIPGVTKNDKYAHVTSRVGEYLRNRENYRTSQINLHQIDKIVDERSTVKIPPVSRLSRSTTDLRDGSKSHQKFSSSAKPIKSSSSAHALHPTKIAGNCGPTRLVARRTKVPVQESVYNWRFADSHASSGSGDHAAQQNDRKTPVQYHRVEYLPCDGICADEPVIDNEDSGRSTSSRTSRGCNTEETRLISDNALFTSPEFVGDGDKADCDEMDYNNISSNDCSFENRLERNARSDSFGDNHKQSKLISSMEALNVDGSHQNVSVQIGDKETHNYRNIGSNYRPNNGKGDLPHNLGSVPKYLQQRKEMWKNEEEAKKEAEKNAWIPSGHVLLSEPERMDTLKTLKGNYDSLIQELNRIPIHIDTIRVRDHKAQLEKQLSKLEDAIKIFSRPKVLVKMD